MRTTKPGLGGPMGKGDFEKGRRLSFLLELAPRLKKLGWVPMVELKGDDLSDAWLWELHRQLEPWDGIFTWHWSQKSTKKLGDPAEPISEQLRAMAHEAKTLKYQIGLAAVTIHCAPAMFIDPLPDAGLKRYNSPISAREMLEHIRRQIEPLRELRQLTGNILQIENVDIANFSDSGYKLPNYLALQTGSWLDLLWLRDKSSVQITFDSEHHLCAGNLLMRRREMRDLPSFDLAGEAVATPEFHLSQKAGYWLRKGHPPGAVRSIEIDNFIDLARPRLFHFGGAVQAYNEQNEICTHLPYDSDNQEQMEILDLQLKYILEHECLGGVIEVTGQLYVDDPANPGLNRYSNWSPRPADDELAKEQAILTIIDRIEKIQAV